MTKMINTLCATAVLALMSSVALAKLPAPSDEAKAKAAEAAAKTAWAGKVDGFQLCKAQDKVVAHYKKVPAVKDAKTPEASATPASACVDPGPFVYMPAGAASAPAASASGVAVPAAAAVPAASAASQAKKS